LFVQVTRDGVPVLYPKWALPASRHSLISRLNFEEFKDAAHQARSGIEALRSALGSESSPGDLTSVQRHVALSYTSLAEALALLPAEINLEVHVCYPTRLMEETLQLGPTQNINVTVDAVLMAVFDHARHLRETQDSPLRSFVFSSYNADICVALNWKQPNCKLVLHRHHKPY
jgi:CDK inhibitor PHO81